MTRKLTAWILSLLLLLSLSGCATPAKDQEATPPAETASVPDTVPEVPEEPPAPPEPTVSTLVVCGDAMSHMPITNDAWDADKGVYDYTRIMSPAGPIAQAADYAVVNLETTMSGGPNYSGYPTFNSPDDMAYGLKEIGFDLCLTANNHCMDKGFAGLSRTLDVLDEAGLAHVGTSRTQEEADSDIVLADVGGISVAFLGYTYGTNGIPVSKDHPYSVNLFNTDYLTSLSTLDEEKISSDLEKAKDMDPDLIAVMIHWGVEYQTTQNSYQEQVADFLFDHGADLVLGGHPHVLQPAMLREIPDGDGGTRQGFVCYSLGNFISSQNDPLTDTTVALSLELTRDNVTGVTQVTDWSYTPLYMLDREAGAVPRFDLLNAYDVLESGQAGEDLEQRLAKAIDDCHQILGSERDPRADQTAGS